MKPPRSKVTGRFLRRNPWWSFGSQTISDKERHAREKQEHWRKVAASAATPLRRRQAIAAVDRWYEVEKAASKRRRFG